MFRPQAFTDLMTGEAAVALGRRTERESEVPGAAGTAPERLAALFDAHHQRLYRLARRMSRDAEDARDLVQETFLRAARSARPLPDSAPGEEAWLVRVLINLCRDRWRQAATRQRLDAEHPWPRSTAADPETAFVARSLVWTALAGLAPRRRAILIMHELEGAPVAAIARLLGVTAVTVRWHLSRGRHEMATLIREQGIER